jgi:hypothetical protein
MEAESNTPNARAQNIPVVNSLWESSCPPLNPMEIIKYKAMNLALVGGISKSLFSFTAKTPRIKKRRLGLVRLLIRI